MAQVRIEHNGKGWIEVFKSDGMRTVADKAGERIASEAGEYFKYYPKPGSFTEMGFVSSTGPSGAYYEATDKRLTKAVHR